MSFSVSNPQEKPPAPPVTNIDNAPTQQDGSLVYSENDGVIYVSLGNEWIATGANLGPQLESIKALEPATDNILYGTDAQEYALTPITPLARTFIANTTGTGMRNTINAIGTLNGVANDIVPRLQDGGLTSSGVEIDDMDNITGALSITVDQATTGASDNLSLATKGYVDVVAGSQASPFDPVRYATAAILPDTPTYASPAQTLTSNSGTGVALLIDGQTPTNGDRVLIKDQVDNRENGIYVVTDNGAALAPWQLTRASDFNQAAMPVSGNSGVFVEFVGGIVNQGSTWNLDFTIADIDPLSDAIVFVKTSEYLNFTAGDGIDATQLATRSIELSASPDFQFNAGALELASPVAAGKGGTGRETLTMGHFLIGAGTGPVDVTKPAPSGDVVGTTDSQTLTNKTLTAPKVNQSVVFNTDTDTLDFQAAEQTGGAATVRVPDMEDNLQNFVLTTQTQTLTNKTLTSPTINSATINNPNITGLTFDDINLNTGGFDASIDASDQTVGAGTANIPDLAGTTQDLVLVNQTQTLTNKTITDPSINNSIVFKEPSNNLVIDASDQVGGESTARFPNMAGSVQNFVLTSQSQTLTNKTLTSPTITNPNIVGLSFDDINLNTGGFDAQIDAADQTGGNGTASIPDLVGTTQDLVLVSQTQTLTNKTLTSPTINNPVITGYSFDTVTLHTTGFDAEIDASNQTVGVGTANIPDLAGTTQDLVLVDQTQVLTNKTLMAPSVNTSLTFNEASNNLVLTSSDQTTSSPTVNIPNLLGVSQDLVLTSHGQTLSNKILASPSVTTALIFDQATNNLNLIASDQTVGTSTANLPNLAGTTQDIVLTTQNQTLSNKTLTSPTISDPTITGLTFDNLVIKTPADAVTIDSTTQTGDAAVNIPDLGGGTQDMVLSTQVQTLTNKTLTSPTINNPTITGLTFDEVTIESGGFDARVDASDQTAGVGTANIPNLAGSTQDIVLTAQTQTLTNKTLSNPTITSPTITGLQVGDITLTTGGFNAILDASDQTVGAGTVDIPDLAGTTQSIVLAAQTQTLTNKTLTTPTIDGPVIQNHIDLSLPGANDLRILKIAQSIAGGEAEFPDLAGTTQRVVMAEASQTLSNKTFDGGFDILNSDTITVLAASQSDDATLTVPDMLGNNQEIVMSFQTQTLSNKTLASPVITGNLTAPQYTISTAANTLILDADDQTVGAGTANIPDLAGGTDTFVMEATTQTLSNKSFSTASFTSTGGNAIMRADPQTVGNGDVFIPDLLNGERTMVLADLTQTLSNKTLDNPVIQNSLVFSETTNNLVVTASDQTSPTTVNIPNITASNEEFVLLDANQTLQSKTIAGGTFTVELELSSATNALSLQWQDQTVSAPTLTIPNMIGIDQDMVLTTQSQTLTNKTLNTPSVEGSLQLTGDTNSLALEWSDQSASGSVVNLPDLAGVSSTIVFDGLNQSLTNKTISDPSNTVRASLLATSGPSGDPVNISTSAPSAVGEVLAITNATSGSYEAQWQTVGGGGGAIQNVVTVAKAGGDYSSIRDAITAIGGGTGPSHASGPPSATNRMSVVVAPGDYVETNPIVVPEYVSITGIPYNNSQSLPVEVQPVTDNLTIFDLSSNSSISFLLLKDCDGTNGAGIICAETQNTYINGCTFINCDRGVLIEGNGAAQSGFCEIHNCTFVSDSIAVTSGIEVDIGGSGILRSSDFRSTQTTPNMTHGVHVKGADSEIGISNCYFNGIGTGVVCEGSNSTLLCQDSFIQNCVTAGATVNSLGNAILSSCLLIGNAVDTSLTDPSASLISNGSAFSSTSQEEFGAPVIGYRLDPFENALKVSSVVVGSDLSPGKITAGSAAPRNEFLVAKVFDRDLSSYTDVSSQIRSPDGPLTPIFTSGDTDVSGVGDIFYLGSGSMFTDIQLEVVVSISPDGGRTSTNAPLTYVIDWEYWDGADWKKFRLMSVDQFGGTPTGMDTFSPGSFFYFLESIGDTRENIPTGTTLISSTDPYISDANPLNGWSPTSVDGDELFWIRAVVTGAPSTTVITTIPQVNFIEVRSNGAEISENGKLVKFGSGMKITSLESRFYGSAENGATEAPLYISDVQNVIASPASFQFNDAVDSRITAVVLLPPGTCTSKPIILQWQWFALTDSVGNVRWTITSAYSRTSTQDSDSAGKVYSGLTGAPATSPTEQSVIYTQVAPGTEYSVQEAFCAVDISDMRLGYSIFGSAPDTLWLTIERDATQAEDTLETNIQIFRSNVIVSEYSD